MRTLPENALYAREIIENPLGQVNQCTMALVELPIQLLTVRVHRYDISQVRCVWLMECGMSPPELWAL